MNRGAKILVVLLGIPVAWVVFAETRKNYWESKVKALCREDGGIVVFEKASLDGRYIGFDNHILLPAAPPPRGGRAPFKWEAKADDAYFYRNVSESILEGHLSVWRGDTEVVRATDNKVLGRMRSYFRSGGDAFVIDHHSNYHCPEAIGPTHLYNSVFGDPRAGKQ